MSEKREAYAYAGNVGGKIGGFTQQDILDRGAPRGADLIDQITTAVKQMESETASSRLVSLEGRMTHALERIAELEKRGVSPILLRSEVERLKAERGEMAATIADMREQLEAAQSAAKVDRTYWSAWKACCDALGDLWEPKKDETGEDCASRVIRELKAENQSLREKLEVALNMPKGFQGQPAEAWYNLAKEREADAKLGALVRAFPDRASLRKEGRIMVTSTPFFTDDYRQWSSAILSHFPYEEKQG